MPCSFGAELTSASEESLVIASIVGVLMCGSHLFGGGPPWTVHVQSITQG